MNEVSCPHCGQKHALGLRFCPNTGAPMPEVGTCPHCAKEIGANWNICASCGQPLGKTKKNNKPWMWILVSLITIGVVAIIIYGLLVCCAPPIPPTISTLPKSLAVSEGTNSKTSNQEANSPTTTPLPSTTYTTPEGLIVYQRMKDDGVPIPGLIISNPMGNELRTVDMPIVIIGHFPIQTSQRALVYTLDQKYFLINTELGTAMELNFPLDPEAGPRIIPARYPTIQGGNKEWLVFSNTAGRLVYLVNLISGEIIDLRHLSKEFIYGSFTPNEDNLLLFSDTVWVVPTSDPDSAIRLQLCDAQVISFSLSEDGSKFLYICGPLNDTRVYIAQLDGSSSEFLTKGMGIELARFVPGNKKVLLVDMNTVRLLLLADHSLQTQFNFSTDARSRPYQFSLDGRHILFERLNETPSLYILDLETGEVRSLDKLDNYKVFPKAKSDWVILQAPPNIYPNQVLYAVLNLKTGGSRQIFSQASQPIFPTISYSPTDDKALIYIQHFVNKKFDKSQLWLVHSDKGEATLIAESPGIISSEFTPNGQRVVAGTLYSLNNKTFGSILLIDTENLGVKTLAEGIKPIWVYP